MTSPIIIVGAGVAGLITALKLSPRPVTILTARPLGLDASSVWPQVGM
ncbi:MAG: FAD-dependent oxidoreductase, partial [Parvularculaceae bacterium]|nr:FAD-dependent oxidoreductase [Parvularculaceae bacterium]